MTSLQQRLTLSVAIALITLLVLAGLLAYPAIRTLLKSEFDEALLSRVHQLTTPSRAGTSFIERLTGESMAEFQPGPEAEYFEIRTEAGEVIARAPSLAGQTLLLRKSARYAPAFFNVKLPGGRSGRAVALRLKAPVASGAVGTGYLFIFARDTSHLDASYTLVLDTFIVGGMLLIGLVVWLVHLATRRGLRPFMVLVRQLERIHPRRLDTRIDPVGLPAELRPVVVQLNSLLARLEDSFEGERQFSANAAHELLTPVSELRAMAENALQWRDDPAATCRFAKDALESANQMERLVKTLLNLARREHNKGELACEVVDVVQLIETSVHSLADRFAARQLALKKALPEMAAVLGNPSACSSIVQNLFENALEYTPAGGDVECRIELAGSRIRMVVANSNPGLSASALERIWDPFWRRDPARSDRTHAGLGLPLVRALAEAQGFEISASLLASGLIQVELFMPLAPINERGKVRVSQV